MAGDNQRLDVDVKVFSCCKLTMVVVVGKFRENF
jgi:hypothetical protein